MTRWWLFGVLTGCGVTSSGWYDDNVRDIDGDGAISERFGGPDCRDDDPSVVSCDADGDGFIAAPLGGDDCDDNDATVHPGAIEVCDGIDNDCNNSIDNDDPDVQSDAQFFPDADRDGFGEQGGTPLACAAADAVADSTDCDDNNAEIRANADELCDGFDNNCDGVVDDVGLWLIDADGDGFGVDGTQASGACDLSNTTGLAAEGGDCDDSDAHVHPQADEVPYDGIDANCNGGLDDWDQDFDAHVPIEHWVASQSAPGSDLWNLEPGDCDDTHPGRFVGNPEVCDGIDNDCDELVDTADLANAGPDEELVLRLSVQAVFTDLDGDGHFGTPLLICPGAFDPLIHSSTNDDCYDAGTPPAGAELVDPAAIHPAADELCDGFDNNCDGRSDWSTTPFAQGSLHFLDGDGDGFGTTEVYACQPDATVGIVVDGDDCNDVDIGIYPDAPEICGDAQRQDCSQASIFDCDGDGYEGAYVGGGDGTDCADELELANPGTLVEICDGIDNDCDGFLDSADLDNLDPTVPFWYVDQDQDGFGVSANPIAQCDQPSDSYALLDGDCDDNDPDVTPTSPWYRDLDGDGYGDPTTSTVSGCSPPDSGVWVRNGQDCTDVDANFNPETVWRIDHDGDNLGAIASDTAFCAPENDGLNWVPAAWGLDCDDNDLLVQGAFQLYVDHDGDGAGDPQQTQQACAAVPGLVLVGDDCDDNNPNIGPAMPERCNAIDDDCDGLLDADDPNLIDVTGRVGYEDLDGDGFGGPHGRPLCFTVPPGLSEVSGDCNDYDPDVFPGQIEVCNNGIDDDCDGEEQIPTWYTDADGDGFGEGTAVITDCVAPGPTGYSTNNNDCDDTSPDSFPGAPERDVCDAIDDNCDGIAEPRLSWYFDRDLDGYGDDLTETISCSPPLDPPVPGQTGEWRLTGGDCDDDPATGVGITFGRVWYLDQDGDGLGNDTSTQFACPQVDAQGNDLSVWLFDDVDGDGQFDAGDGQLSVFAGDCNDNNAAIGLASTYYTDADQDGWGDNQTSALTACPDPLGNPPTGLTVRAGDCDDSDAQISPEATETDGDGLDSNCDGLDDNDLGITWYPDADGDGLGANVAGTTSYLPGMVNNHADCDDADASVTNGIFVYNDLDGDGFGAAAPFFAGACTASAGQALVGTDCNDSDAQISPAAAPIVCDGIDNDCTGLDDAEADLDGDGVRSCDGDCDDLEPARNPFATEICDGVLDNDCDPSTSDPELTDVDGDGFASCDDPDPSDPNVPVRTVWYGDLDGDGYGDPGSVFNGTTQPSGFVAEGTDCDDSNPLANPGIAVEYCDGVDNNCDGVTDLDGGFDVPNPYQGVLVVGGLTFYFADYDGNGLFSVASPLFFCNPYPVPPTLVFPDGSTLNTGDTDDNLLDCDDYSNTLGTLWSADPDLDGYPTKPEMPSQLYLECGANAMPAGFAPFPGDWDCSPFDPTRTVLSQPGAFADVDGDGRFWPYDEGVCAASVTNTTLLDCDDNDGIASTTPSAPVVVTTNEQLRTAVSACQSATIDLQGVPQPSLEQRPAEGVDLVFTSTAPDDVCSSSNPSACLNLRNWSTPPTAQVRFQDIGLTGSINAAGPIAFSDTSWIDLEILSNSDLVLESSSIAYNLLVPVTVAGGSAVVTDVVFSDPEDSGIEDVVVLQSGSLMTMERVEIRGGRTAVEMDRATLMATELTLNHMRQGVSASESIVDLSDLVAVDVGYTGASTLRMGQSDLSCVGCSFEGLASNGTLIGLTGSTATFEDVTATVSNGFVDVDPGSVLTLAGGAFDLENASLLRNAGFASFNDVSVVTGPGTVFHTEGMGAQTQVTRLDLLGSQGPQVFLVVGATLATDDIVTTGTGGLLSAFNGSTVTLLNTQANIDVDDIKILFADPGTFVMHNATITGTGRNETISIIGEAIADLEGLQLTSAGPGLSIMEQATVHVRDTVFHSIDPGCSSIRVDDFFFPSTTFLSLENVQVIHNDPLTEAVVIQGGNVYIDRSLFWSDVQPRLLYTNDQTLAIQRSTFHGPPGGTMIYADGGVSTLFQKVLFDSIDPISCPFGLVTFEDSWTQQPGGLVGCLGANTGLVSDETITGAPNFNSTYVPLNPAVRNDFGEYAL